MSNEAEQPKRKGSSGLIFVGCLLGGMGIGFTTGNIPAGLFIGMGVGFIAMAIVRIKVGEW
jgi:hypothetical protein